MAVDVAPVRHGCDRDHQPVQHVDIGLSAIFGHVTSESRQWRPGKDCTANCTSSHMYPSGVIRADNARREQVEGSLHNVNSSSTVANIADGNIAYINCNNADFPGFVDPQKLLEDVYNQGNISGVILYSTVTDYCDYNPNNNQQMMQQFAVFSMTNQQASASLLNDVSQSSTFPVKVQGRGGDSGSGNGSFAGQNPLGPSPSTAVAMIILYSITGIITALFLVIIITGAVRAHRHPERYGPRNVLGRPRQSRARGLGRAILETIPIVKFGEKEPAKPTDVELASTAETSRSVNGVTTQGAQTEGTTNATTDAPDTTATTETTQARPVSPLEEHQEGIAAATAAAAGKDSSSHDDTLGCSICTEDFEKGQDLRVLPCDHKFHPECVDPWLLNVSGTCPLWYVPFLFRSIPILLSINDVLLT